MILRVITITVVYLASVSTLSAGPLHIADDGLSAGYVTLAWPEAKGTHFDLEIKRDSGDWQILYLGRDRATTLSGLADGSYQVRMATNAAPLKTTDTVSFTVKHHSLGDALAFFGSGAVIFLILLVLLLRGGREADEVSSGTSGRSHI